MEDPELGHQLRVLRTAAGRTVASVAVDAGLSVPYIRVLDALLLVAAHPSGS